MRFLSALFVPAIFAALTLSVALFDLQGLPLGVKMATIAVATLLFAGSNYGTVYAPLRHKATERQKVIVKIVLDEFVREYVSYTHSKDPIRMNVRLMSRPIRRPWLKHLRTWFELGDYSDDERSIVYSAGQGVCGKAFADNDSYWYDRQKGHDQYLDIPQFSDSVHRNVSSQLCVPIYSDDDRNKDRPLGVLSIDSPGDIERSKFDDDDVRGLARLAASKVGIVLSG